LNKEVAKLKYRKVKKIEEKLSTLGYGCWGISGPSFWDGTTDDDSIKTIRKAVGEGINFFDVAPVYGFGHAEEVLGKAIKGMRNDIFIATKCGLVWDQQNRISNCLKPESIRREIEASLRRLQTDRVDLYQLHWPDPRVDIEETMDAVNELKKAGMIRYIGLSNFSLSLAERAMKVSDIASMQGLYNMLERNPKSYHNIPLEYAVEKEVLPFVKENGMAFLPYSPLFQGLLTGTFDLERENFSSSDVRSANPKLSGPDFEKYYSVVKELNAISGEIGKPLSQIAINWLLYHKEVTSIIAGAQNIAQLEQNLGAVEWEIDDGLYGRIETLVKNSGIDL